MEVDATSTQTLWCGRRELYVLVGRSPGVGSREGWARLLSEAVSHTASTASSSRGGLEPGAAEPFLTTFCFRKALYLLQAEGWDRDEEKLCDPHLMVDVP